MYVRSVTVFVVTKVSTRRSENHDCRCIDRIAATEYRGDKRIELTPEEAFAMVSRNTDRLWATTENGFVPVIPASRGGLRYVRTEPIDTSSNALISHTKIDGVDSGKSAD